MIHRISKIFYSLPIWLFLSVVPSSVYSQRDSRLLPGEKVPDIFFPTVLNGNKASFQLSDFKTKIIILDYWNIWCSSCIEGFPKMTKLQKQFGNELMILPISFINKKAAVQDFLARRKGTTDEISLPLAVFENTKNPLFQILPTVGYPHYVWIDKNGVFLQTSSSEDVNEENIRKAIAGQKLNFAPHHYQLSFRRDLPLLTGDNGGADTLFSYRSLITPFIDGISMGLELQLTSKRSRVLVTNYAPLEIIKYCLYNGKLSDTFNQYIEIERLDTNQFIYRKDTGLSRMDWLRKYAFCYDLTLPAGNKKEILLQYMRQDIERFFNVTSKLESRERDCLVLRRADSVDRIKSKSRKAYVKYSDDRSLMQVRNRSVGDFLAFLSSERMPILIDGSEYKGNIDIDIELSENINLFTLNKQLLNWGLQFYPEKRKFEVAVITSRLGNK